MTVVVLVNYYYSPINIFRSTKMSVTKEILSFYSENESTVDLLLNLLLSNNSYTEKLQRIAEDVAKQAEVTSDE